MNTLEQSKSLIHVRNALYGQPWAITEDGMELMASILEAHLSGHPVTYAAAQKPDPQDDELGFYFENNVAVIPVQGPIFPKANLMTRLSGATSLEDVSKNLQTAAGFSPNVIILDVNSPGGSVMGAADFAAELRQLCEDSDFDIVALVNPMAASLAYWISSQCDAVYATPGGMAGSIGVIARLDSNDRAKLNYGIDSTIVRSHELKAIGAGPVTPNQQTELQRMVSAHFAQFRQSVIQARPQVDMDDVGTGQMWMSRPANDDQSAEELGLIDGISTLPKLIKEYAS